MRKTAQKATVATVAMVVSLGLAGCSDNADMGGMPGMDSSPASSQAPSSGESASVSGEFNEADVTFLQMMIPHHEQAVAMSDIILKKSGVDSGVVELAKQIKAEQQPEIETMNSWLEAWGSKNGGGMGGMGSGDDGMATAGEMEQLDKADAATAQKSYLEMMTQHHEGAIAMANTEMKDGRNPDAVQLAKDIVATQQEEITTMKDLLAKL